MTFLSGVFFVFIIITVMLYFLFPLNYRWIVLLISSIAFYLSSGIEQIIITVTSILVVHISANVMAAIYGIQNTKLKGEELSSDDKKKLKLENKRKCRHILIGTVVFLVLILIYCKTGSKLLSALNNITAGKGIDWPEVIVPLGVSYYTFSMIGYLADVYWQKEKPEKNFWKFTLFVLYFPHILQGPIARHKKLAGQLIEGHAFDYQRVCYGLQLALYGYFKKLVIADRLSIFVNNVFSNCYKYEGLIFVLAAMLGSIQLYCDFSGCMDIAAGVSQVFGIEIERNFNHPFFARSAAEFWRRWHITLGSWFKDYVYMPLVISPKVIKIAQLVKKLFGNRAGKAMMTVIPLSFVWVLTGLWHGTGYNYVAWGMYWGTIIIISSVFAPELKNLTKVFRINTETTSWKVIQMIRTFLLFSIGRLITLPGHLRTTWDIIQRIFKQFDIWILFDGSMYDFGLNAKNFWLVMIAIIIVWCISRLQEKGSVRDMIASNNIAVRWLIYYLAFYSVVIFGMYGSGYSSAVFTYMNY